MIIMKKNILTMQHMEYPELKRLLELKNNSIQRAECEIRKSLYAEKEQIQKIFCDGRKFSGTVGIYMSKGDIHRGGRSVAKVELDNGTILYYKPHSLDKNIKYQELFMQKNRNFLQDGTIFIS